MNWRIGPWREIYLLKCKVKGLEEAYQRMKNNELLYRNMWLTTYRSLIAQQKGCIRLRRRLNKLLAKKERRHDGGTAVRDVSVLEGNKAV